MFKRFLKVYLLKRDLLQGSIFQFDQFDHFWKLDLSSADHYTSIVKRIWLIQFYLLDTKRENK